MLVLLVVIAVGVVAVGVVVTLFGGQRRFDEVDRFHRASRMTTEWARAGVSRPLLAPEASAEDRERSEA